METTCLIDGCEDSTRHGGRGWCRVHYMRWYTKGDPGPAEIVRKVKGRTCSLDGCDRKHQGRGYCDTHLQRFIKYGDPGPAEIEPRRPGASCSLEGCDKPHQGRGLCDTHLQRFTKYGTTDLPDRGGHGPRWAGEEITYQGQHIRLRNERGRARDQLCAHCGSRAQEWAYDHTDPAPKFGDLGQPYSPDINRYLPLCRPCHRRLDVAPYAIKACSVDGCDGEHHARGMCNPHYRRALRESRGN